MDTTSVSEVVVASDGAAVLFPVFAGGREVRCSITRDALEQFFWLASDADAARLLKAFADGRNRIVALAVRKALRLRADSLELTASDVER